MSSLNRRRFLRQAGAGLGILAAGSSMGFDPLDEVVGFVPPPAQAPDDGFPQGQRDYTGPNVILIRFGGGVRRLETILDPPRTYCPFIYHELARHQGILYNNVDISDQPGVDTSHGQGTLYLVTGRYQDCHDIEDQFLAERFEPQSPTVFEYFRRNFNIPAHQALIVNGEDRVQEEFFTYSDHHRYHHDYGVRYKATVLSLFRFKMFLLREQLADPNLSDTQRRQLEFRLRQMETRDYRSENRNSTAVTSAALDGFWRGWRDYYGTTGMVNPRGDRLLTTLALRAMNHLRPKLMMINYNDPDYVHWGNPSFYTRSISIIDEGVREIYLAAQAHPEYRDNTVFVVVPDCGRDNNRCMAVPFQHHFNTASSHEIFAVVAGPREFVAHPATICDRSQQQISVTRTIANLMGFAAPHADAPALLDT